MSDNTTAKIPPQNIDAEKSLLGAILIDEDVLSDASEIVKPKDFYDKNHQTIFNGMISLYEKHSPVDMLTLTDELKRKNQLEIIGGSAYLSELTNYVPTAAHADAYANMVAQLRLVVKLARWDTMKKQMYKKCYQKQNLNFLAYQINL